MRGRRKLRTPGSIQTNVGVAQGAKTAEGGEKMAEIPMAQSLASMAEAIARGEVSALAATESCLAALESRGRELNCVVRLDADRALQDAAQRDRVLAAGRRRGRLHGVPLAHKDMFDRIGCCSRWGSLYKTTPASETAALLQRLDAAGSIDLGRLHMTELALDSIGSNDHFGPCFNPLTPERVAGGSSSGPAVAVAAGLVPASVGSDTGGSIRTPAAFCGVYGLKPTRSLVDLTGAMPLAPSLDSAGPIARSAADLALMMSALSGEAASGERMPWLAALDEKVHGLRIGLLDGYFARRNVNEVASALAQAVTGLRELGMRVVQAHFTEVESCIADANMVVRFESSRTHGGILESRPDLVGPWVAERLRAGLQIEPAEYGRSLERRHAWQARFIEAAFDGCDILVCATVPTLAPRIADAESDIDTRNGIVALLSHNTRLFNYLDLPALNVPLGGGIGMQLIGRPFDDRKLLRVARHFAAAAGRI